MLGVLCGFHKERNAARKFARPEHIECSGAREDIAIAMAEKLASNPEITHLISFGVAGGIIADLKPHMILVGQMVCGRGNHRWSCDKTMSAALIEQLHAMPVNVYGSPVLVPTPAEKDALAKETGCAIVDMESSALAEAAEKYGKPFTVLRGISDEVNDIFPHAAFVAINADGSINHVRVMQSVAKDRTQIPHLQRLNKNTNTVLRNMRKSAPAIITALAA